MTFTLCCSIVNLPSFFLKKRNELHLNENKPNNKPQKQKFEPEIFPDKKTG